MDKLTANGGPPSYTAASGSSSATRQATTTTPATSTASAVAPSIESSTASMSLQDNSNHNESYTLGDLPRGVTVKEALDPGSAYSITKVALDLPHITTTKRIPGPPPQPAPLPPFLLQCTLFASFDVWAPHPVPFRQAGCPATYSRGLSSATSKSKVSQTVTKYKKRLGVQIPLSYLGSPGFNPNQVSSSTPYGNIFAYLPHPHPRNGAEMSARSGTIARLRRVSLFQAQGKELTGIVSRPLVERVVSAIYAGQGITNKMAIFPAEAVLRYSNKSVDAEQMEGQESDTKSGWLSKLKAKAKGGGSDQRRSSVAGSSPIEQVKSADSLRTTEDSEAVHSVKAAMMFATLDLLAPPPRLLETGGPYPIEMNKASDADLATSARMISEFDRGTDDDRFNRFFFAPSAADEQLCADMLRALERRGAIWVEAGRLITPSSRNPNPRERARFLVKGVFPERFVYRCKYYRGRKFEPMPSDLDPKEVKKFGSPLIVHTVVERTGNEGIDLRDHLPSPAATRNGSSPAREVGEADEEARLDWRWDEQDNITFDSPSAARAGAQEEDSAAPPDYKSMQRDTLNGFGIESPRAKALIEAERDFFEGWSIGATEEPFKNGGFLDGMASATMTYCAPIGAGMF